MGRLVIDGMHVFGVGLHRGGLLGGGGRRCLAGIAACGKGDKADGRETAEDKVFHATRLQEACHNCVRCVTRWCPKG